MTEKIVSKLIDSNVFVVSNDDECLIFDAGAAVVITYADKKDAIQNEIYPKILMTEEFKEYQSDKEEKLISALQDGIISTDEFARKNEELTNKYHVLQFAKDLPEFSAQVELAEEYDEKSNKWTYSLFGMAGVAGAAIGSVFSVSYARENGDHFKFDNQKDIEKQKKRLQAKQEKLTKKEKEL